ncbi:hypothetical protein CES85_3395 (plasmid) [Ochrobactrum quorumnocens]|uniref:Uncharacterized protein n=1 Tax=Ochrobactrum quorumnocens TaxID=271865 RepID=A0A248UP20_9HYPH|nr:hypothetical protein CES85_3395 [[Ochrobactrum] quorumnocens]
MRLGRHGATPFVQHSCNADAPAKMLLAHNWQWSVPSPAVI